MPDTETETDPVPEEPTGPLVLRIAEVCKRTGLSEHVVRGMADSRQLPSFRTAGGERRFFAADVDRFIAGARGQEPA